MKPENVAITRARLEYAAKRTNAAALKLARAIQADRRRQERQAGKATVS